MALTETAQSCSAKLLTLLLEQPVPRIEVNSRNLDHELSAAQGSANANIAMQKDCQPLGVTITFPK